ncbi:adenylate cyclase type 2-like protein [Cricetulus griseus]|nr:adenylate cyclase type 2-like protein [Cricetulus griseus]
MDTSSEFRGSPPSPGKGFLLKILANVIIFICGNLAGAYHKHLMELALQQTYRDTCNCIKSRIKLEFEKRQQQNSVDIGLVIITLLSASALKHWDGTKTNLP